jgi:hypothetical protein
MLRTENPGLNIVGIYVWRGRAFIPTQARYESGIFVDVEPVYIAALIKDEMMKAIQAVKEAGHILLPDPETLEEFIRRKNPMLAATKARSWKELAQKGTSYTVGWTEYEVRIDMSRLDKKGRLEYDLERVRILPPDTALGEIVEIILEDIKTRLELSQ